MGGLGGARRRLLRWIGAVAVLALAVPVWQMIANATVTPSGNVTVAMATTIHAADFDIGPINLSAPAAGSITNTGALTIPAASIKFGARHVEADLDIVGDSQTLSLKAATAFTGTVNPTNGVVTLSGKLNLVFKASGGDDLVDDNGNPYSITCTSPAFTASLSTANGGGTPYNQANGKATVASTGLDIAALPVNATGCGGWEDDVNFGLDLPASSTDPAASQTSLAVGLTFSPVIHGPTTTVKSPTTVHGGSSSSVPGSSTPTTPTTQGGGGPTTVNTTTPTTKVTPTTHGGGPTTVGTTTPTTKVTPTTHTTGPSTSVPKVTTTTWPQHCTDGDPTRCHDTHHPHPPRTSP